MSESRDFPKTPEDTRKHLLEHHGYPNRAWLRDELPDDEVIANHLWEHDNDGRHSAPNHEHVDTISEFPSRMVCVRWYLGDECHQEHWANGDSENDMEWVEQWKRDALKSSHPAVKLTVASYIYESDEVVTPSSPLSLAEVVGS